MSRSAAFEGASPPAPPTQLCPISTEISAAPMASRTGTAAATTIRIRRVRLRVRTGTADGHPPLTALTTQPKRSCRSVILSA